MTIGKAIAIFKDIQNEKWTDAEKVDAIEIVLNMETHTCMSKLEIIIALNWLWDLGYRKEWYKM